ncbi:MFS general substrate transporter [Ramicandelaber brevisporus]|nr:MFS general substrate transporter [Ramicandelaber brevisporus]
MTRIAPDQLGSSVPTASKKTRAHVQLALFIALLLDIVAFTAILPLLPSLLRTYLDRSESTDIMSRLVDLLSTGVQTILPRSSYGSTAGAAKVDSLVLLGGLLGTLFALLQAVVSPSIGRLADAYGRRPMLLLCTFGNIVSTVIWLLSPTFGWFLVSRVVAGLTEGNVHLTLASLADLTDHSNRSRGMALVGIAFSIGFTVGPGLSAYFFTKGAGDALTAWLPEMGWIHQHSAWMAPGYGAALSTLLLLVAELLVLWAFVPETLSASPKATGQKPEDKQSKMSPVTEKDNAVRSRLWSLHWIHFLYVLVFSGMEYTLTFLTSDLYRFDSMQQGKMLGSIGIVSALMQGGFVRRYADRLGRGKIVTVGMISCGFGLLSIASASFFHDRSLKTANTEDVLSNPKMLLTSEFGYHYLLAGALGLAIASATVINCLNAIASLQVEQLVSDGASTGYVLGTFRSAGQIGRTIGPMVACAVYWRFGGGAAYLAGSLFTLLIALLFARTAPAESTKQNDKAKND